MKRKRGDDGWISGAFGELPMRRRRFGPILQPHRYPRTPTYVGIDPGLSGAVVMLPPNGEPRGVSTPVYKTGKGSKRAYLETGMDELFRGLDPALTFVVLERAHAMPGQGVSSSFKNGEGYGLWRGILVAHRIPFQVVSSSVWHRALCKGVPGADPKAKAIHVCQSRLPELRLILHGCRVVNNGISDAGCLALYAQLLKEKGES